MQLTRFEADVLAILANNARLSNEQIAVMLGHTPEQVADCIADLEAAGVVAGFPAAINWEKTPVETVEAIIEVRVSPVAGSGYDSIAAKIENFEQVESVYLMSGAYDLHVRVKAKTLKELAMFVASTLAPIENVLSTATHFILKKYKTQGIIMEKTVDKRQVVSQ